MRFWDSSAIVPVIIEQRGTSAVRKLMAEDEAMAVWWGTVVECEGAIARLGRDRKVAPEELEAVRLQFAELEKLWTEIVPSADLRYRAVQIVRRHSLRAADALQLAAAIYVTGEVLSARPFVSLDRRLREAAAMEGFAVLPAL